MKGRTAQDVVNHILSNITINDKECWEWQLSCAPRGYGHTWFNNKRYRVHRLMYDLFKGGVKDKLVMHSCDNPKCCNPEHLMLGTNADNSQDMVDKKRSLKGGNHPNTSLTTSDVEAIKSLLFLNITQRYIAECYNLSISAISLIKKGKNWGHVAPRITFL